MNTETQKVSPLPRPWLTALPGLGGFLTIYLVSWLGELSELSLLMAPFGASCVLAFALPESPLAQPRNLVGGHVLSTAVGLTLLSAFGSHSWAAALGVGLAIALMQLTKTVHPPAGADPLVVLLGGGAAHTVGWSFLLTPVLLGSIVIVLVAWGFHRLNRRYAYPKQWW
ncbi:HPP family protein [Paenibacillus sp. GD4]|uniref:HPP family protein n=1 Tax=Paenibacillus sp. GD4 TaxID=3068890 RepID=UPI0027967D33|nr:HPP family protein [Paenibacillus sp. GD4]MDQ1911820.1 HPP family protein [Paenibacillus sp. GD4]